MSHAAENTNAPIVHGDLAYPPASAGQRWWARIIDGVLVIGITAAASAAVYAVSPSYEAGDNAAGFVLLMYPLASMVLGLLYGWGIGIGQLITRCKSRRTRDGRRVGGFRGWMRYWGIAFFPLAVYLLFDAPTGWSDDIRVFKRAGRPMSPGMSKYQAMFEPDPARDARFAQPDPYQNGQQQPQQHPHPQPGHYPPSPGQQPYPPQ